MISLELLALAVLSGGVAWTLQQAMTPGMLLHFWMNVLDKMNRDQSPQWQRFMSKPMGYCGFCFSFWVALFIGCAMSLPVLPNLVMSLFAVLVFDKLA